MPYDLEIPQPLRRQWKVKVLDKETLYEEPHVTIFFRATKWRYSLRNQGFLDDSPDPDVVPQEVLNAIHADYTEACRQWDIRFPTNPVQGHEDEEDNK